MKLVFSYVVKGIKIKVTAKFRASRRLRFEDTKRIMLPEIRPKRFGTFEKQVPWPANYPQVANDLNERKNREWSGLNDKSMDVRGRYKITRHKSSNKKQ